MAVKTFNSKEVQIIFGPVIFEGYADGTFCTAAHDNDAVTDIVGSDGEGALAYSNDERGSAVITLLQTSASNPVLSAIKEAKGIHPLFIKDGSGTTIITAETAWILKSADVEYSREITNRVWTLRSTELKIFVGDN